MDEINNNNILQELFDWKWGNLKNEKNGEGKERIKNNATTRTEKAKDKKVAFGRDKDPKVTLRASEQYIENMNILIDTVISIEAKRIKEELEVIKEGKKVWLWSSNIIKISYIYKLS